MLAPGHSSKAARTRARPLVGLARIAVEEDDPQAALKFLEKAEQANPNFVIDTAPLVNVLFLFLFFGLLSYSK